MVTVDELREGTDLVTDIDIARIMIGELSNLHGADFVLNIMLGKATWAGEEMLPRYYRV